MFLLFRTLLNPNGTLGGLLKNPVHQKTTMMLGILAEGSLFWSWLMWKKSRAVTV